MFQSSPAPRSGCNMSSPPLQHYDYRFNPHPLRGAGATLQVYLFQLLGGVSILTRSEERVQQAVTPELSSSMKVSILTRSEERVQLVVTVLPMADSVFQSSPAPRSGCNQHACGRVGGRSIVSILTRSEERVQPTDDVGKLDAEVVSILT